MSCGVACRRGWDPVLQWLWLRPAAVAPIQPLAWELPYATGSALKSKTKTKTNSPKPHTTLIINFYDKYLFCLFVFASFFAFSRAAPAAYGGSQARGLIGAVATGLRQSHSNTGSELSLRPTPQLTATPDR